MGRIVLSRRDVRRIKVFLQLDLFKKIINLTALNPPFTYCPTYFCLSAVAGSQPCPYIYVANKNSKA
jgi:hypothetical protein